MANDSRDRLFHINGYGDDFVTGVCADGRQVVMGLLCPHLVAYFFDSEGRLIGEEHQPWRYPAPLMTESGPYHIYDEVFQASLATQLRGWQQELGFCASGIRIQEFLDPRHPVGIELAPNDEVSDDEWLAMEEEERQIIEREREEWALSGQFVWWWGKDYWMSPDGEVVST